MHYLETNYDAADRMERHRVAICEARERNDANRSVLPGIDPVDRAWNALCAADDASYEAAHRMLAAKHAFAEANRTAARLARAGYDRQDVARVRAHACRNLNTLRARWRRSCVALANARVALDCARIAAEMQEAA